jgi:hypothetical protein
MEMILYVKENESTSCCNLLYFYEDDELIPSELEANHKSESLYALSSFSTLDNMNMLL